MSNEQRHIIKRQILEVEVGSAGINGQAVQQRLSEVYRDRVIPALEKTLNRLSDRDRRISIDRLEIDLGELSLDDLDGNFSQKVEEQLFRVIREKMHNYHLQKELAAQGISTRTEDDGNVTVKTSAAAKADLLAGFLKTGRIPWNAGMQASSKPVSNLLEELLEEAPAAVADLLKRELRYSLQRTRFILQMPDDLIRKTVAVCVDPGAAGYGKRSPAGLLAGFAAGLIEALNRRELQERWNSSALRTRTWGLVIERTLLKGGGSGPAGTEEEIHDLLDGLIFGRGGGDPALPQPQRFLKLLAGELHSTAAARESGFAGRLPAVIRRYEDLNRQRWGRQQDDGAGEDGAADVLAETKRGRETADREIDGRTTVEGADEGKGGNDQTADKKRKDDRDRGGSAEEWDSTDSGPKARATDADGKDVPDPAGLIRAGEERGPDARRKRDGSTVRDGDEPGKKAGLPDQADDTDDTGERQRPDQAEMGKTGQEAGAVDSPDSQHDSWESGRPDTRGTSAGEVEGLSESEEQPASEDTGRPSGTAMRDKENAGDDSRQKPESEENRAGAGDGEKQKRSDRASPQAGDESAEVDAPPEEIHRSYKIGEKADEAWVQNAGLVLLHPFLVRFFDQAGLVKEKQFLSQDARVRAVHLLQYIVTGEQQTPEQELFLNKLLCGLEPEYPVPSGIKLTRQEKEESENLLKSVVGHWTALKKSSPEAVRSTFLRREGLVSREGMHGGWKVAIERNTFDVLLDRLPWGLSMVKMPWNSYLIHVEW